MGRLIASASAAVLACLALAGVAGALNERGGPGADVLKGTGKADTLRGLRGRDRLIGGPGDDVLIGGKGGDRIKGGAGFDSFNMRRGKPLPAAGNDRIEARDKRTDAINCGAGKRDVAIVDKVEDGVYDCEKVKVPK